MEFLLIFEATFAPRATGMLSRMTKECTQTIRATRHRITESVCSLYLDTTMAVANRDAQSFQKLFQNVTTFSEKVTSIMNTISEVFSEVFHVPLNDGESVSKLKISEKLCEDDFTSHLEHLSQMCSLLETADENPITLKKLKNYIGRSLYEGNIALKNINSIDGEVVQKSIKQISALKPLASKFKKIKEDQNQAFETSGKEEEEGSEGAQDLEKAIMSNLRSFLAKEARRALFGSKLKTDPETLLNHLKTIERGLQETREVISEYQEALRTVIDRMKKVKQENNVDVIVSYVSGIKDEARSIVRECARIKPAGQK